MKIRKQKLEILIGSLDLTPSAPRLIIALICGIITTISPFPPFLLFVGAHFSEQFKAHPLYYCGIPSDIFYWIIAIFISFIIWYIIGMESI